MQKNDSEKLYKKYIAIKENNKNKWSKEFFKKIFFDKKTFFFFHKKNSRGYLIARKILDEFEILSLATNKNYFRKGIASELIDLLIDEAKEIGVKKIFLEVATLNVAAISLYTKMGFIIIGKRNGYYIKNGKKQDAYNMVININRKI